MTLKYVLCSHCLLFSIFRALVVFNDQECFVHASRNALFTARASRLNVLFLVQNVSWTYIHMTKSQSKSSFVQVPFVFSVFLLHVKASCGCTI
ncbi:MAG: hypothetical protein NXY57DRAFT_1008450 [Lentinula lateritia]|nr:MAG: hypothetical protein NXY57DRAFT_1008450 [Lentinula lateritia]